MGKATPESKVKDKTKALIKEICGQRGLQYRIDWNAGSAFMSNLDAVGVIAGHPFVAEVKRFDKPARPTARQLAHMQAFRNAGAYVHDISDPTALVYLELWLQTLEPRTPHSP